MATPTLLFKDGFESGDLTGWDISETDASGILDVLHYTELARRGLPMPYSGAYCTLVDFTTGGANADFGDSAIDIADGETCWFRFNIWVSPSMATDTTANDAFTVLNLETAGSALVYSFGLNVTAATDTVSWRITDATAGSTTDIGELGVWYTIELKVNVQTLAATGEIELYVTKDGEEPSTTVTDSITGEQSPGAVAQGKFGAAGLAATTRGMYLIDNFTMTVDGGSRLFPDKDRFSTTKTLMDSRHVFVGPGRVNSLTLAASAAADNEITVYDTDTGQTHGAVKKTIIKNATASEIIDSELVPFDVIRGCYVEFTAGTETPEVLIRFEAPNWFSEGNMKRYAMQRSLTS